MGVFQKPFPIETDFLSVFRRSVAFGLFVFLFLLIFQPFGLSEIEGGIWLYCAGYGLVTTFCMLIFRVMGELVFPEFFEEENWTMGKEVAATMINILLIALGNLLFSVWAGFFVLSATIFLVFLFFTLAVAIFPVSLGALLKQNSLEKRHIKESIEANTAISEKENPAANNEVTLKDEEGKPALRVRSGDLFFLESADNYVKAFYREGELTRSVIFRGALSKIEIDLPSPPFLRCHRSYLVNTTAVEKVSGNARGYQLSLSHTEKRVPVARRRIEAFNHMVSH